MGFEEAVFWQETLLLLQLPALVLLSAGVVE